MTDHGGIEERIAAYALDASDPEDRETHRELLDHLAGCASCQSLYRDMREAAGDLALAASPREVSEALEERVMGAVRGEPRVIREPLRRQGRAQRALAAAAVAVVAVLGVMNVQMASRLGDARSDVRDARVALEVLSDPRAERARLSGTGDGTVTLAVSPDGNAVLVGDGLTVPEGRVLEIWLLRGEKLVPSETFTAPDGRALVAFRMDPARDRGVALTIEETRVLKPTGDPVFVGTLRA